MPNEEKYKIVMISDHPLSFSGVGLQSRYIMDHLVKTGKFKIISIAAAMKHQDYRPQKVDEWGDDAIIIPCDGYGNPSLLRQIMDAESPDAIWIMTDPRFYEWLFTIENEVHQQMPILWNTIWDNYPAPQYNKAFYESADFLGCINKLTYDICCELGFKNKARYIPHGVPEEEFKILHDKTPEKLKIQFFGEEHKDSFVLFYNSRNAMRKRTGNVIMAFKHFRENLPEEEKNKAILLMHTPPKDHEGQDLYMIIRDFGLQNFVRFSEKKIPTEVLTELYNMSNLTISLSSEEGFGLCVIESLMCGTPVIATKTGGMQDQLIDEGDKEYGICISPDARSLIGSQQTPYIWSDHVDPETASRHIKTLYDSWKQDPVGYKEKWAGEKARASMLKRFNLDMVKKTWELEIIRVIEEFRAKNRKIKINTI